MVPASGFEQHSQKLVDLTKGHQERMQLAIEVKDSIEIVHTSEYANFLKWYFTPFCTVLTKLTIPQFEENCEHKTRNIILEVLSRLPHNESLRPHVVDLMKVALLIVEIDNEENALICLRIIFDLHKNYRQLLEQQIQPFLDFVKLKVYQNFGNTVCHFFSNQAAPSAAQIAGAPPSSDAPGLPSSGSLQLPHLRGGSPPSGTTNASTRSFKVVTECPLIVMFLFQLYSHFVQNNIPILLPLMVQAINQNVSAPVLPHLKQVYQEMKAAQVKTVSFLTYLLRSWADCIRPYEVSMSKGIVQLLVSCPDSVSVRKELLVATRHVLATDFRKGFYAHIDTLLDERVLIGSGRACYETLRPLAYSLLAELIHNVRLDLGIPQLSKIVYLFSRNVHDASLPLNIQVTCVRLMVNLVETIYHHQRKADQGNREEGRLVLAVVLDCFVGKFASLRRNVPHLLKVAEGDGNEPKISMRSRLELPVQAVLNLQVPLEPARELQDTKQLIRTLVGCMKALMWSVSNFNQPIPQAPLPMMPRTGGMTEDEVRLSASLIKHALVCLALFKEKEDEEVFASFAAIFVGVDPRNFMDMFSISMPILFDSVIEHKHLIHVHVTLLQNPKMSRQFAEALTHYLVTTKLDALKQPDSSQAKTVQALFKQLLAAMGKMPGDGERILQPHLPVVMEACLKGAQEHDRPAGYLHLLKTMFRALTGNKYEALYRDFANFLPQTLTALLAMLEGPPSIERKYLLVELLLTLPVRLSLLLTYLPRLMGPLVHAFKGPDELVGLGFRTLEFWVDSLNPEFLEPSMASVMSELVLSLWAHLRPKPYPFGAKALILLGKLGGRNRRFLKEPLEFDSKENPEHGLRLILTFNPGTSFLVPMDRCIHLARTAVMNPRPPTWQMEPYYRRSALKFLRVCLASVLNLKGNLAPDGVSPSHLSAMLMSSMDPSLRRPEGGGLKVDLGVKTKTQLMAERAVFKQLLMTVIAASAETDLQEPRDEFVSNVCRHFAMLFHVEAFAKGAAATAMPKPAGGEGSSGPGSSSTTPTMGIRGIRTAKQPAQNLKELDPLIFLDALVAVLADENRTHAKAALQCLNVFAETLLLLARAKKGGGVTTPRSVPGTPMTVSSPSMNPVYSPPLGIRIPVFDQLLPRLLHCCYGATWQSHMGGVMGLGALVGKAPVETICVFQVRAVQSLLHVLKRLPAHASKEQEETSQVLTQVLRVANNVDDNNNEQKRHNFKGVLDVLAAELCNASSTAIVRQNVQACLSLLASRNGSEVSELLEPYNASQLQPLINKSLLAKPLEQQIGTVMALNFCLGLQPPLLKTSPELIRIFQEALGIAQDDSKYQNMKVTASRIRLRTSCIELLCTAMARADLKSSTEHNELSTKIIEMFFKSLTCRMPEIVAVAKEGLRQVIIPGKMPKELLQNSLRPILINLANWRQLTMPLLQGLARLLEMLSSWFNVTLGEKLIEHLKRWLEPDSTTGQTKTWRPADDAKIAAAIIELFHLLPNAAKKFLDQLVSLTIQLEGALPVGQVHSELNSPFRLPLTKYLNKYSAEAVDYFLLKIAEPPYFNRLIDIIKTPAGQPLREQFAASSAKIIEHCFSIPEENLENYMTLVQNGDYEKQNQGIILVAKLAKLMPDWLAGDRTMFDALVKVWRSYGRAMRLQNEQILPLNHVKESKLLVKCFLSFVKKEHSEVDVLFEAMSIFLVRTRIDFTFFKEYLMLELATLYTIPEKKAVLVRFLQMFHNKEVPQDRLVVALQTLIIPMLTHLFDQQMDQATEVMDKDVIKKIVEQVLDPPDPISEEYEESLRIELLQLATLLIRSIPMELQNHKKELIKFGWNHLKREESVSKQWAFVNVCHFLEAFQAPEKIVLQVFVALLRTCQPETKMLVRQALDVLMPALPRRLPQAAQDSRMPIWLRYTKKVLLEEGHSMSHIVHVFQILVRHQELFYSSRGQFVGQMVTSLSRLGLPQNATESRRLAVDLAGLVILWEKRRLEEAARAAPGGTEEGAPQQAEGGGAEGGAGVVKTEGEEGDAQGEKEGVEDEAGAADGANLGPGAKRTSSMAGFPASGEDLGIKRIKTESGSCVSSVVNASATNTPTTFSGVLASGLSVLSVGTPGGSTGTPSTPTGASGAQALQAEDEFKPSPAMEEMIINFLVRIMFLTEQKDKETTAMYKHTLSLISQALEVWPHTHVKFNYMERLLTIQHQVQQQVGQGQQPAKDSAMLLSGLNAALDVIDCVLQKQAALFVQNSANQILQVIEPCFDTLNMGIIQSMCNVIKKVYLAFPPGSPNLAPEVAAIYKRMDEQLVKHMGEAKSMTDLRMANTVISGCRTAISMLAEIDPANVDRFLPLLVALIMKQARDLATLHTDLARRIAAARRGDDDVAERTLRQAEYAATAKNIRQLLQLASKRILAFHEQKVGLFQSMMWLFVDKGSDPSVLMALLETVKDWVDMEFTSSASPSVASTSSSSNLTPKDVQNFLTRLAQVDRRLMKGDSLAAWDDNFLKLLLKLCTDSQKYPQQMRQEIFSKVERMHMLGLRAKDPEIRSKFFALYHDSIPKTLFSRLQYIISGQEWDALADSFWLKQGLDLLLAILNEDEPITLAPNSAQVPPLMSMSNPAERPGGPPLPQPPSASSAAERPSASSSSGAGAGEDEPEGPLTLQSLVNKHARFLNEASKMQVQDLVLPLRELAHIDPQVAYHMWVLVFPIVWATLAKEEQVTLAKPIITLLSKDYHIRQQDKRPNVVQALLEGISLSQPQPKIPSELIKFLGRTFNAWHKAIPLLESHVLLFPQETRCFEALAELYRGLNEEDILFGLWKRPTQAGDARAITADTRAGLSLVQHGQWVKAQDVFYHAMSKGSQVDAGRGPGGRQTSKSEICLWEEQWIACARRLNQWDLLTDFGKSVDNYDMLMESLWKQSDWVGLKELMSKALAQVDDSAKVKMVQAYLYLHEGNVHALAEADRKINDGVDQALQRWWQLPELGVQSHIPVLQQFQQLVELQESVKILQDIANGTKEAVRVLQENKGMQPMPPMPPMYTELKDILETWRLRVPNDWDELPVWVELLQWRNHLYNIIIEEFKGFQETNRDLYHLGFRDKAWSVNRLAHIARRQGLPEVCIAILNKMYGFSTMEVQEAFAKIREQAKANLDIDNDGVIAGMDLISTTNLEYFQPQHKAELFRLKGEFYQRLNDRDNANKAFSAAIVLFKAPSKATPPAGTIFKHLPKGWISWGHYCDQIYSETDDPVWLEYAVSCFLQGVKYGSSQGRSHLARVLYLLSFDRPEGTVGRAFDKYWESIPHCMWLPWIPQLLLSLQRPEAQYCKAVLFKVAVVYPQALYYWLRTYLLERREIATRAEQQAAIARNNQASGSGAAATNSAVAAPPVSSGGGDAQQPAPSPSTGQTPTPGGEQSPSGQVAQPQQQQAAASAGAMAVQVNSPAPSVGDGVTVGTPGPDSSAPPRTPGEMAAAEGASNLAGASAGAGPATDPNAAIRRSSSGSTWASTSGSAWTNAAVSAFLAAKEVMEMLRSKHTNLASELEVMLTEVYGRLAPLPEERLLAVVHALLQRCYKYPTPTTSEVPINLKKELGGVCRACFSTDTVSKHMDFVNEYKREFERDLDPDSTQTFPTSLAELTERLKHWKGVLQSNVEDRLPAVLRLEEESTPLRDFQAVDVEVPGQYFVDQEIAPDLTVKLDRIGADVPIVRRHGSSHRRVSFIGSDGSQRHFLVQTSLTPSARSDERMVQLFRVMNRLLDKHKESRRRNLSIHTPIIIPVWPQVRLVEDDVTYSTFGEVYEINCARYGREADLPITHFKERLNAVADKPISPEMLLETRQQIYMDITKNLVSENVFSQYMYKTLPTCNHLWTFKKQLCVQLALSAFVSYSLRIGGRAPTKILFAKNTGKIFQMDFHPTYDAQGMVECNEAVPFRLTRNLQTFFTPFGVEGLFVASMCAAGQALLAPRQQHLQNHLAMFFRDDLVSWPWRRPAGQSALHAGVPPSELKQKVAINVESVMGRIKIVAPQEVGEQDPQPLSCQRGVSELVDAALRPTNLCMMDPTWHPWF